MDQERLDEVIKFAETIGFKFEQTIPGYIVFTSKVTQDIFVDIVSHRDTVRVGIRNLYSDDMEYVKEFAGEVQKAIRIAEKLIKEI